MLAAQIPPSASVLDIGCGDGAIGTLIAQIRPDIAIQGVEFLVRPECKIECTAFDGSSLPFPSDTFDVKDHLDENIFDDVTLRFMDWVSNRPHGVVLTYNYQSRREWAEYFLRCGLAETTWTTRVPLYPPPVSLLAGRGLHFVSLLRKTK